MKKIIILSLVFCLVVFSVASEMDFLNSFISKQDLTRRGEAGINYYISDVSEDKDLYEKLYLYMQLDMKSDVLSYSLNKRGGDVSPSDIQKVRYQMSQLFDELKSSINNTDNILKVAKFSSEYLTEGNLKSFYEIALLIINEVENVNFQNRQLQNSIKEYFENIAFRGLKLQSKLEDSDFYSNYILFAKLNSRYAGLPEFINEEEPFFDAQRSNQRILEEPVPELRRGEQDLTTNIVFHRLLSNKEFIDSEAMTQKEIQNFLEERNSGLKDSYNGKYPSQMIADACQKIGINPKIMLATLQKEKGLVGSQSISKSVLDWAMGVGCYDDGTKNTNFKGFYKQIESGAETFRHWYEDGLDKNISDKGLRLRVNYNREWLTVWNEASYSLYRYTPHTYDVMISGKAGGNFLFARVYIMYFNGFVVDENVAGLDIKHTTARANMRRGPGTSHPVITTLAASTEVKVLNTLDDDWCEIQVINGGTTGFIANWLLE
ncbi:MAG: SH3 domain-containing protein [Candidatus Muiribacteriota bacterium]